MTRILIIDDEPDFTELFKQNLEDSGSYEVEVQSDPKKAVETAREFKPDLIFVDVVMPGMDGGDVVMALKGEAILARKPILMLTALIEEDSSSATGESERGGLTFISKTTRLDKILAIIEKHLAA
ncbi:MAG: response regulator [Akkermansiaceae bacterium]|nr:response regulator [Akkermansiaceae bacterium]